MPLTFGSLFAGIGGFDLGFERAGMVCKWQVEIDGYANRVLAKHWPNVRRWPDVRTWPQTDTERVDVICGGFPCQDISYAGQGAGLDGERSGLFFEAVRVVRELRPRIVVLENVAALLTRGLDRVLGTLAEIGYDAEWHCIPAAAVGAPHIRDRVFVVANTRGERNDGRSCECGRAKAAGARGELVGSGAYAKDVADAYCGGLERRNDEIGGERAATMRRRSADASETMADANEPKRETCSGYRLGKGKQTVTPSCDGSGRHQWSVEPDVGRVANGVPARVDRLRGLGNAVVPQVAEWIGRRIVTALDSAEE